MEFNKFFKGQLKRVAQNVYPTIEKKRRIEKKISEMQAEMEALDKFIEANEVAIKEVTGYSVVDLVTRRVEDTGKKDKDGRPIKVTKYELKYPETVVPPVEIEHDGEHHLMTEEGEELPLMTEDVFNPAESVNFDGNNPNMI